MEFLSKYNVIKIFIIATLLCYGKFTFEALHRLKQGPSKPLKHLKTYSFGFPTTYAKTYKRLCGIDRQLDLFA